MGCGSEIWRGSRCSLAVIASEAKQSKPWPQGKYGLLRCARNDVVGIFTFPHRSPASRNVPSIISTQLPPTWA